VVPLAGSGLEGVVGLGEDKEWHQKVLWGTVPPPSRSLQPGHPSTEPPWQGYVLDA